MKRDDIVALMPGYKQNPNRWPIIDEWNYWIWQKNKFKVFEFIEKYMEERLYNEQI